MECLASLPTHFVPLQAKWVPNSDRFITLGAFKDGKGGLSINQLDQNLECHTLRTIEKPTGFRCCSFGIPPYCLRMLTTGQYDGTVSTWDLQHFDSPVWTGKHENLVNYIDTPPNNSRPEFLSASRDGLICLWDSRTKNPVLSIKSDTKQKDDPWVAKFGLFLVLRLLDMIN